MISLFALTDCSPSLPTPPIAPKIPTRTDIHGVTLIDNYFWLREKSSPEVISYLNDENRYTEAITQEQKPLSDAIYKEIRSKIVEVDMSVPFIMGQYSYYSRFEEDKQYPIYCRKTLTEPLTESILLDLNQLGEGKSYISLGEYDISPNESILAYSLDTTGFRQYTLLFKSLSSNAEFSLAYERVTSFAWASDNSTFFFTTEDSITKRSNMLFRASLSDPTPTLLYEESDELFQIIVSLSRDKEFVLLQIGSSETSEVRFLKASSPLDTFTSILPRQTKHEYSADHWQGVWIVRTNKNAKNFRLVSLPIGVTDLSQAQEILPYRPDTKIESVVINQTFFAFQLRKNGLQQIELFDPIQKTTHSISFSEPAYALYLTPTPEYQDSTIRFNYQSFITPSSIFEYHSQHHERVLLKEQPVLGDFDRTRYVSERIAAKAPDGTAIPISLVYKKGTQKNRQSPLLLYGYGSYGISIEPTFSLSRFSLLDRGVIYAIAHIRGGGDLGEEWHDEGKMMKKNNTFTDFIACADFLVSEGFTTHSKMAIQGGSAGGLLIGAVLNRRPDLCKVAHLAVPFVDVINTMLDSSLPLTTGEYIEWGNPTEKDAFEYMSSYCPYTNIQAVEYPAILVTTSLNDSQVMYWEPAKYTAKLRAYNQSTAPILLRCNMGAGHGGASGRFDRYKEVAFEYAFLLWQLGIKE